MLHNTERQGLYFTHLPAFAAWLLQNIDEYTTVLVGLFYEVDLPILKTFQHLSEAQKFDFSKRLNTEFLTNLSQNNAAGHIEAVTNRWLANRFENVERLNVSAKDITLINYVRSKAQKKFISRYTGDWELAARLHSEIDELAYLYNAKSIDDYLHVLQNQIEEEAHFSRNIIEASPGVTFIYDLVEQRELYITGRVEEVTGFTAGQVATKDLLLQLIHPEDIPVVIDFFHTVEEDKKGETHHADCRLKTPKGDYHWLRCYAVVYKRNSEGKPVQLLGTAFDVSNEKLTAFALEKRERQLLEAQTIGVIGSYEWNIDSDTSITTPEVLRILESERHLTLKEMFRNIHPDDAQKVKTCLAEAFLTGAYRCEFRYLATSGVKVIDAKGVVAFSEEQKPRVLVGTIQDVTERKRVEESLRQKTIELERSNEQLHQFASIASHDLKEPLRKIGMFTNIIMTSDWSELPERTKVNIQKISEAAARMQQLIEGVLSYSSINAQLQKESASLENLLQEAISNLDYKIKETGAVITSDGLPQANVIALQVQQLFQNLLANALKFATKTGTPLVKVTHQVLAADQVQEKNLADAKQYLQVCVADNGIGFSEEATEKIFGLFQRLHNRSDYEGSGIGLAICKRIVENHGGAIRASSKLGAGSVFTLTLPLPG